MIHVCGQGASCGAVAHVYFGGATKELKVEMHLPFVGHSKYIRHVRSLKPLSLYI